MATKMAEMKIASPGPIDAPAWPALQAHYEKIKDVHLRRLFAEGPKRVTRLTAEGAGLFLDYSKNRVTDETIGLLLQLARERGVAERHDAMFRDEKINITEKRAVLHVALRAPRGTKIEVDDKAKIRNIAEFHLVENAIHLGWLPLRKAARDGVHIADAM